MDIPCLLRIINRIIESSKGYGDKISGSLLEVKDILMKYNEDAELINLVSAAIEGAFRLGDFAGKKVLSAEDIFDTQKMVQIKRKEWDDGSN